MSATLKSRLGLLILVSAMTASACEDLSLPTTPTPTTTDIFFTSQLMANGVTSRSFKVAKAGEVKVLFTSLLPDTDVAVAVAIGSFDGTTCTPTTSVSSTAGSTTPIITTMLTVGDYCLRLADPGVLTKTNDFSLTVTIPAG